MSLILVLAFSLLNRVRGGGLWVGTYLRETLRVKPLFVVTPLVFPLAMLAGHPWYVALCWALGYLVWALPAWGRWFDLNTLPDDYGRQPGVYADPLEKWIDTRTTSDGPALALRHGIMLFLVLTVMSFVAWNPLYLIFWPIMTSTIVYAYAIGIATGTKYNIAIAELLTGLTWGLLICVL